MLKTESIAMPRMFALQLRDYNQLLKLRLSSLVVFSAALAYLLGINGHIDWVKFTTLILGGFLVTGGSNGLNQIFERDTDKLMERTKLRPLPDNRMSMQEAMAVSLLAGALGLTLLFLFLNFKSGMLGTIALLSYAFVYTPMKRSTPFAVFVGAIPGAIPTLLGWVAATNSFSMEGWILFGIQFMWQFPHFWAIAWKQYDDYKRAGFEMLPAGGKSKASAFQTAAYAFTLIPLGLFPYFLHISGIISAIIITLTGIYFFSLSVKLLKTCDDKDAKKLMFGSFIYLPVVLLALVIDKIA
jgi:protoheme IX farnesyltransferase